MSDGGSVSLHAPSSGQQIPTSSGSFTNLGQYVAANKEQARGLGGRLEENVQKAAGQGLSTLSEAGKEYKTNIESAGVKPEDFSEEKVTQAVTAAQTPQSIEQQAKSFEEARTKQAQLAKGSEAVTPYQQQQSFQIAKGQMGEAAQKAGMTGIEAGRQTLLQEAYKRPDYSKGQQSLDQLLTQTSPENRQRFENLRQNLLGQYGLANTETQSIQQAAQQRQNIQAGTEQSFQNINTALYGKLAPGYKYGPIGQDNTPTILDAQGNEVPKDQTTGTYAANVFSTQAETQQPQYGALPSYYQQLQAAPQAAQTALSTDYQNKAAQLAAYFKEHPEQLYGTKVEDMVARVLGGAPSTTASPEAPGSATLQNVMTPEQLARVQALNTLAGRNQNLIGFGAGATQFNPADITGQPRFSTTVAPNLEAGKQLLVENRNILGQDLSSKTNIQNIKFPETYGKNLSGQEAVNYSVNQIKASMSNPEKDAQENYKVYNTLNQQLQNLNNDLAQKGLPPIQLNDAQYKIALHDIANQVRNSGNTNYKILGGQPDVFKDLESWADSKDTNKQRFFAPVQAAAKSLALSRLLAEVNKYPLNYVGNVKDISAF